MGYPMEVNNETQNESINQIKYYKAYMNKIVIYYLEIFWRLLFVPYDDYDGNTIFL